MDLKELNAKIEEIKRAVEKTGVTVKHIKIDADVDALYQVASVVPKVIDLKLIVTFGLELKVGKT